MYANCQCGWSGDIPLKSRRAQTWHKCWKCREPITSISTFQWAEWLEERVDYFEEDRAAGLIGTRRQSKEAERDISVAGIGAELAACLILCPWRLREWQNASLEKKNNRGSDFPATWFKDGRPIEVKYTAHRNGHLLVRPPSGKTQLDREDIDDSLYVLMVGVPHTYRLAGWAGRSDILSKGIMNPVPRRGRQRECIGLHMSKLNDVRTLFWLLSRRKSRLPDVGS